MAEQPAHLLDESFKRTFGIPRQYSRAVGALTCQSGRSQAVAIKNVCKDEALSYLIPNRQPQVDQCMFRHMAQNDTPR